MIILKLMIAVMRIHGRLEYLRKSEISSHAFEVHWWGKWTTIYFCSFMFGWENYATKFYLSLFIADTFNIYFNNQMTITKLQSRLFKFVSEQRCHLAAMLIACNYFELYTSIQRTLQKSMIRILNSEFWILNPIIDIRW
jgi:phage-related holin